MRGACRRTTCRSNRLHICGLAVVRVRAAARTQRAARVRACTLGPALPHILSVLARLRTFGALHARAADAQGTLNALKADSQRHSRPPLYSPDASGVLGACGLLGAMRVRVTVGEAVEVQHAYKSFMFSCYGRWCPAARRAPQSNLVGQIRRSVSSVLEPCLECLCPHRTYCLAAPEHHSSIPILTGAGLLIFREPY